jgi:hypothetical protein
MTKQIKKPATKGITRSLARLTDHHTSPAPGRRREAKYVGNENGRRKSGGRGHATENPARWLVLTGRSVFAAHPARDFATHK